MKDLKKTQPCYGEGNDFKRLKFGLLHCLLGEEYKALQETMSNYVCVISMLAPLFTHGLEEFLAQSECYKILKMIL